MSTTAQGFAACKTPERYIKQLVSHWGHNMATNYTDGLGAFPFDELRHATMQAHDGGIAITLVTPDAEENVRMRGVIERHIDRFAFREAPLSFEWNDPKDSGNE
jgi:hypothetical protein